ncbi:MAG: IS1380 family transposase [Candidatus Sericytochromatia bacterium]
MRLLHASSQVSVRFDEPNLVSCAGLVPLMRLAARCGLPALVSAGLTLAGGAGAFAAEKVMALLAGMAAGGDSIEDMDLLRHGGMRRLFSGVRAPSTLGTFLRAFTFGHVRQLDSVAAALLARLAGPAPLLAGREAVAFVDVDDTVKPVYGYHKQGAGHGHTGVKGLNALLATISTPTGAPLIAATRLRRGACHSARGAARLVADAVRTARRAGATGLLIVRADSAYYGYEVVAAARRANARFSVTARLTPAVTRAIAAIGDDAWAPIRYPDAVWDDDEGRWISDAEVAEIGYTAFTGRKNSEHVTARLIVRRVRRLNVTSGCGASAEQAELFAAYRYHACFSDSPLELLQAEACHRGHAVVEQVIADLKAGPLAHLPSGSFAANAAWLVLAAMAFNLTRAAGSLASAHHAKATTATVRRELLAVPARLASSARRLVVHLPRDWPWETAWQRLHSATHVPPPLAA